MVIWECNEHDATHTHKKRKYVYDQTFFHKDGWTDRMSVPNTVNEMSRYIGSDEDDTPLSQLTV